MTILKLAEHRHRAGGPDAVTDRTTRDSLTRAGLEITRRNAFLYNLGTLPAGLCIAALIVFLLLTGSGQAQALLARTPLPLRLLGCVGPALALWGVSSSVRRRLPALALGLRHGLLFVLGLYLPVVLIINLVASAQRADRMTYGDGDFDWWFCGGGVTATVLWLVTVLSLVWPSLRQSRREGQVISPAQKRARSRSAEVRLGCACLGVMAILTLTAHHAQVLRYLLGSIR